MIARSPSRWFIGLSALVWMIIPVLTQAQAQDVSVRGGFLSDSLKIGEQTAFYLSARYPTNLNILFPDSTHGFTPFEYEDKEYFPTETTAGISADSAVYYLTTFEIDRVQLLQLPVYIVNTSDCTAVYSAPDSVLITQFVAAVPDTVAAEQLPLKMNTAYQKVFRDFNTWMLIIILTILLALVLVVWIVFGKRIQKYFALKRLQRNHASFQNAFDVFLAQLRSAFSPPATESALFTWKKYMEQLESRPYTKLTTRETLHLVGKPELTEPLSRIDQAIYGHPATVVESLENLKRFADQQFQRKLKEVQHG